MSDQDEDSTKAPCSNPGVPVAKGVVKKSNLAEQARRSREEVSEGPAPKKLPPKPGRLPDGRPVDPKEILNRD